MSTATVESGHPNSKASSYHNHKPRAPRGTFHEPVDKSKIQHLLTHARHYNIPPEDKKHLECMLQEYRHPKAGVTTEYEISRGRLHAQNPASMHHASKKLRETLAVDTDGNWRLLTLYDSKTKSDLRTAIERRDQNEDEDDTVYDSQEDAGAAYVSDQDYLEPEASDVILDSQEDAGAAYVDDQEDDLGPEAQEAEEAEEAHNATHDAPRQLTEAQGQRIEKNRQRALAIRATRATTTTVSNATLSDSSARAADVGPSTHNANAGIDVSVDTLETECVMELFEFLEKDIPDIRSRSVICPDGILVKTTPHAHEISDVDLRNRANDAIRSMIDAKLGPKQLDIRVKEVPVKGGYTLTGDVDTDDVMQLDRRTRGLIRELALQDGPMNNEDLDAVLVDVYSICAELVIPEDKRYEETYYTLVFEALKEWIARGDIICMLDKNGFISNIEDTRSDPIKTTKRAWDALWIRRRKYPVLTFNTNRLGTEGCLVGQILKNIDIQNTDARSLLLMVRILDRSTSTQQKVFDFLNEYYTTEQVHGLHNKTTFNQKWQLPTPNEEFRDTVMDYIDITLHSHFFIFHTIPSIMKQPIRSYRQHEDRLVFELDFVHDVEDPLHDQVAVDGSGQDGDDRDGDGMDCDGQSGPEETDDTPRKNRRYKSVNFQLNHATGYITSSDTGRGMLYQLYGRGSVREFFQQHRGVQGLADLAQSEGIGSKMRYDATTGQWRMFDAEIGIWRHANSTEEATTNVSRFLRHLLEPIRDHIDYMDHCSTDHRPFNWLLGHYAHKDTSHDDDSDGCTTDEDDVDEAVGDASDDNVSSDGDVNSGRKRKSRDMTRRNARGKVKKARYTSTSTEQCAMQANMQLKSAILKFVETPRHTSEVLKAMQHELKADFTTERDKRHLLPCVNGVIDLKTGKLLPKATPDDLFTHMCATEYDIDADTSPVLAFYKQFFPPDAYDGRDQQQALVRFLQQWNGYCLTLDTNLETCVWFHGPGSNGKTVMVNTLEAVMGEVEDSGIHSSMPMATLCKDRGVNNGALFDASRARHVTVSEMDKTAKISEAALRALVSGESQHLKQMWQKEQKVRPCLKLSLFVNELPTWADPTAHCTRRRNIYLPMKKIFLAENDPADMIQKDEYKSQGKPECLIGLKDPFYFRDKVLPHLPAFLKFWVQGAVEFYKNGRLDIPLFLEEHQHKELSDKSLEVDNYVEEHLVKQMEAKLLQRDILDDFRKVTKIDELSFKTKDFFTALEKAIQDKGQEWYDVRKYNGRDGSLRTDSKGKDLGKGVLFRNLTFRDTTKAPWNRMNVVTHDRYTADLQPCQGGSA